MTPTSGFSRTAPLFRLRLIVGRYSSFTAAIGDSHPVSPCRSPSCAAVPLPLLRRRAAAPPAPSRSALHLPRHLRRAAVFYCSPSPDINAGRLFILATPSITGRQWSGADGRPATREPINDPRPEPPPPPPRPLTVFHLSAGAGRRGRPRRWAAAGQAPGSASQTDLKRRNIRRRKSSIGRRRRQLGVAISAGRPPPLPARPPSTQHCVLMVRLGGFDFTSESFMPSFELQAKTPLSKKLNQG